MIKVAKLSKETNLQDIETGMFESFCTSCNNIFYTDYIHNSVCNDCLSMEMDDILCVNSLRNN